MGPDIRSCSHDKFELGGPKMSKSSSKNSVAMALIMAKSNGNNNIVAIDYMSRAKNSQSKLQTSATDHNRSTSVSFIDRNKASTQVKT